MLGALMLLMCIAEAPAQMMRVKGGEGSPMRKLQLAELLVTNFYVDSVDEDKLVEDAIRGMLDKLDPHSSPTPRRRRR